MHVDFPHCRPPSLDPPGVPPIERLAVNHFIALPSVLPLPVLSKARDAARRAVCLSNLRQWSIAGSTGASHNDSFPLTTSYPGSDTMRDSNGVSWTVGPEQHRNHHAELNPVKPASGGASILIPHGRKKMILGQYLSRDILDCPRMDLWLYRVRGERSAGDNNPDEGDGLHSYASRDNFYNATDENDPTGDPFHENRPGIDRIRPAKRDPGDPWFAEDWTGRMPNTASLAQQVCQHLQRTGRYPGPNADRDQLPRLPAARRRATPLGSPGRGPRRPTRQLRPLPETGTPRTHLNTSDPPKHLGPTYVGQIAEAEWPTPHPMTDWAWVWAWA